MARVVTLASRVVTRRTAWLPVSATKRALASVDSARPRGPKKEAAAPTPSRRTGVPEPARVVTAKLLRSTSRTALFALSAMYSSALASLSARPRGAERHAAVPMPFVSSGLPAQPTTVVTEADEDTARRALFSRSATSSAPDARTTMPAGEAKDADAPVPSAAPTMLLPARVITRPEGYTRRTRLASVSATYTSPVDCMAASCGREKVADAPAPSSAPLVPEPASVCKRQRVARAGRRAAAAKNARRRGALAIRRADQARSLTVRRLGAPPAAGAVATAAAVTSSAESWSAHLLPLPPLQRADTL